MKRIFLTVTFGICFFAISVSMSLAQQPDYTVSSMCWHNDRIFIGDRNDETLKEINLDGSVVGVYGQNTIAGKKNRMVGGLFCGDKRVYAVDGFINRIVYYEYDNLSRPKKFHLDTPIRDIIRVQEFGDQVLITGMLEGTKKGIHVFTLQGKYQESMGNEIVLEGADDKVKALHRHFAQVYVASQGDSLMVINHAPLELYTVNTRTQHVSKTLSFHHVVPKPWETETVSFKDGWVRYGTHPRATSVLTNELGTVLITVYDQNKSTDTTYLYKLSGDELHFITDLTDGQLISKLEPHSDEILVFHPNERRFSTLKIP